MTFRIRQGVYLHHTTVIQCCADLLLWSEITPKLPMHANYVESVLELTTCSGFLIVFL